MTTTGLYGSSAIVTGAAGGIGKGIRVEAIAQLAFDVVGGLTTPLRRS